MKGQLICFFLLLGTVFCFGQSSIVDEIEKDKFGKGKVTIYQDDHIKRMLGSVASGNGQQGLRAQGYRVLVFSGNNQRTSKNEALGRQGMIKNYDSEIATYVTYKSPFWRVRVGDFLSYEEALQLLKQLAKEFPSLAREMKVVREEVVIPL